MEMRFPCEEIDQILLHRNSFFLCAFSRSDVPSGTAGGGGGGGGKVGKYPPPPPPPPPPPGPVGLEPYHFYCWDIFSTAPVDIEKIPLELLDFALWKSGMFACPNGYNPMCVQG